MKTMRHSVAALVAIVAMMFLPAGALAKRPAPDATVKLHGKSVAAGIGVSWGKGTLTYKGTNHSFSVEGLSVGDVGASEIDATGKVYHLKKLADFEGTYTAVAAGAAAGGGAGVATMKNAHGVDMDLKSTARGVELKVGPEGLKATLER
jgi:hypothetical protein